MWHSKGDFEAVQRIAETVGNEVRPSPDRPPCRPAPPPPLDRLRRCTRGAHPSLHPSSCFHQCQHDNTIIPPSLPLPLPFPGPVVHRWRDGSVGNR